MAESNEASLKPALIELLAKRSLKTGQFTLASGRTSNIYIDARPTTMSAPGLHLIGRMGWAVIRGAGWLPTGIGGMTLGADPIAYAIAMESKRQHQEIDAFTVRKSTKGHGTGRRIEGNFSSGDAVVVVEDVITTGGSALEAARVVGAAGAKILGVLAVVDREEGGREKIETAGYPVRSLVTLSDLDVSVR